MYCRIRVCWTRLIALLMGVLLLAPIGCSDKGLPIVPVRGKVTFDGGPPPKPGSIAFAPISVADGLPHRPGTANFGTDGQFEVTSFRENDGLVAGTYQASVDCWLQNPSATDPSSFERFNAVPKGFQPPPVTVDADASVVEVVIDVPKKK
jgi:hypothetical protein